MKLNAAARRAIPTSQFAIPEKRKFPIEDRSHAANAKSRASGTKYAGRVDRAVARRFPSMGKMDSSKSTPLSEMA